MSGILDTILMIFLFILGVLPTLYLTLSIPAVIVWKIYRKVKYGYSLYE